MERLTKRGHKFNLTNVMEGLNGYIEVDEILNRLAQYEDLEERGLLMVLPCKVGDDVYRLFTDGAGNIDDEDVYEDKIHEFYFDENGLGISIDAYDGHIGNYTHEGCDTGVWRIFLTRKEAEEALKEAQHE